MSEPLNETLNGKNIHALHEALKRHEKQIYTLQQDVKRLEAELVMTKGDLTNTKQLTAHLNGRGMGPTVSS